MTKYTLKSRSQERPIYRHKFEILTGPDRYGTCKCRDALTDQIVFFNISMLTECKMSHMEGKAVE